jgi:hypothetical protein
MEVVRAPFDLKDVLAGKDRAVGTYWLEDGEYGGRHPVRFLFRSAPDLRVVGRHYGYRLGDSLLWETGPACRRSKPISSSVTSGMSERGSATRLGDEYDRLRETHGIENDAAPAGVRRSLLAENALLREQMTVVQAARMFDRFHAFDAIKDDRCPACGGRVGVEETHNAVRLKAV